MNQVFQAGQLVRVRSLGKLGIVLACKKAGRYRVQLDALIVEVQADDLALAAPKQEKRLYTKSAKKISSAQSTSSMQASKARELDLHGLRVAEAMQLVEEQISAALLQNLDELRVIHGHGTGKIKQALHQKLAQLSVVRHFRIDEQNTGVTRVFF